MQRSIFRPIPALDTPDIGVSKEERLQTIIDNLGHHQQGVRANILRDAQHRVHQNAGQSGSAMDINIQAEQNEQLDHQNFIENVSASLPEGTPDSCLSHGTIVSINPAVRQAPTPLEIQHAQGATDQLDAYDKNARQLRDYYGKALERQKANRV